MKKKVVLAAALCAMVSVTGCGGGNVSGSVNVNSNSGNASADVDVNVDVEDNNVTNVDVTVDTTADDTTPDSGAVQEEPGYIEDDGLEAQMLTDGNINDLVGTWFEEDVLFSRTLYINEDGSYQLAYQGGGSQYGTIAVTTEEHPDGTESYWYTFYDVAGEVWESFAVPSETPITDLYSGQDGELHFVSEVAYGMKPGALYVSSGGGATVEDFIGSWQSSRCSINICEGADGVLVEVFWGDSASVTHKWSYYCDFDEATETLICDGTGEKVILSSDSDGNTLVTEEYTNGKAEFCLNYGALYWTDYIENAGDGMDFGRNEGVG